MGGRKSKPQVQYVTDPALVNQISGLKNQIASLQSIEQKSQAQQQQLNQMNSQMAKLNGIVQVKDKALADLQAKMKNIEEDRKKYEKQIKELHENEKNPAKLKQNQARLFDKYVAAIASKDLHTPSLKAIAATMIINAAVVGNVSVGKSMFLNALFGADLAKTGADRTTEVAQKVKTHTTLARGTKVDVFDVPGNDSKFTYFDLDKIDFIARMHLVVVLFQDTITYVYDILRTLKALGIKFIVVRNKIDNMDECDELPWTQVLARDRQTLLTDLGIDTTVYGISSRNTKKAKAEATKVQNNPSYQPMSFEQFGWSSLIQRIDSEADSLVERFGNSTRAA
jgi:small GTP-binding protein